MPTGYGKSAIYQVPRALHRPDCDSSRPRRPAVVVSPLISLQEDQLDGLRGRWAREAAVAVNSCHSAAEQERAWQAVESGEAAFLFLAPEQLAKTENRGADRGPGHLACSWWTRRTASPPGATTSGPTTCASARSASSLGNPTVGRADRHRLSPVREEIVAAPAHDATRWSWSTASTGPTSAWMCSAHHEDKEKRRAVVEQVTALVAGAPTGPGLLYAAKRKDTEKYADEAASSAALRAEAYHAGRTAAERERVHEQFLDGELDVVVATTAFGMGIDKPNVRFVLHADIPESLDSYYQQIGRAGRDGDAGRRRAALPGRGPGPAPLLRHPHAGRGTLLAVLTALRGAGGPVDASDAGRADRLPAPGSSPDC